MSHRQGKSLGPTSVSRPLDPISGTSAGSHRTSHLLGVACWFGVLVGAQPWGTLATLGTYPWGAVTAGATRSSQKRKQSSFLLLLFFQTGSTMNLKKGFLINTGKHL